MTPIEDKIRHLLARAAHPSTPVEEARTCAHLAAKLMAEHGIEVGGGGAPETPVFGPAVQQSSFVVAAMFIHEVIDIVLRDRAARPPPAPPPVEPMSTPEFWAEWVKRAGEKEKKPRRRSKQSRKNNPKRGRTRGKK
jgi:hypothetical protein